MPEGRDTTPDLSAPHLCQCEDCQRIYREHLARKAGRETTAPITVEVYGEDGEWFVAEGHVPLDAFLVAAVAEARALDYDVDDDEPVEQPPRHRWMRPVLRSDCDTGDEFSYKNEEGWHLWTDDPTEPQATPITVVRWPT